MLIDTYIDRVHPSHLSAPICTSSLDPKRKYSTKVNGLSSSLASRFQMSNIQKTDFA